jgi:glycosyltransferase involved in cell wall biosynthesis
MKQHKLFYGSSYDRGLIHLLKMWADIKKEIPDATLDVCYGWTLFDGTFKNNPERMSWKAKMVKLMSQDGIKEHGRLNKTELAKLRQSCGIWAYPTDFTETNCITALDCQKDGVVPVVINLAGLKETVGSGVKIDGDIYFDEDFDKYKKELIALMKDEKRWKEESEKGKEFAKQFEWPLIASKWEEHFK